MRRLLPADDGFKASVASYKDRAAVAYQVWLPEDQIETLKAAQALSNQSWPDWTEKAIARLEQLPPGELRDLLATWSRTRDGKAIFSFRIYPHSLARARELARSNDVTVQAVFGHAHFIQTLAAETAL